MGKTGSEGLAKLPGATWLVCVAPKTMLFTVLLYWLSLPTFITKGPSLFLCIIMFSVSHSPQVLSKGTEAGMPRCVGLLRALSSLTPEVALSLHTFGHCFAFVGCETPSV